MAIVIQQIEKCRKAFVNPVTNVQVLRLHELEARLFKLQGASRAQALSERTCLLKDIHKQRFAQIYGKSLHASSSGEETIKLKRYLQTIQPLVGKTMAEVTVDAVRSCLAELPEQYQHQLHGYIWIMDGCPNEVDYGRKKMEEGFSVLFEQRDPYFCLKGSNLIEQLYHHIEENCLLTEQQHALGILTQIDALFHSTPLGKEAEALTLIHKLPDAIQHALHGDVFHRSSGHKEGLDWGKKALEANPRLLTSLTHHNGKSLIEQELTAQKTHLGSLETSKRLEEFERVSALYPQLSAVQRTALLEKCSPKVKEWVQELLKVYPQEFHAEGIPSPHLYQIRGAQFLGKQTDFSVFAPHAKKVTLILSAFGTIEHRLEMARNDQGEWTKTTELAKPGCTYQYLFLGADNVERLRIDPYSYSTYEERGVVYSVVVDPQNFSWNDQSWMEKRAASKASHSPTIYEVHVDSWKCKEHGKPLNFRELGRELVAYCKEMNFSHVELYGVLDHKSIVSWGYQVDNYFAPNHRLGQAEDFKFLVDLLHHNNIAVIVDWIPAHFKHDHNNEKQNLSVLHQYDGSDLLSSGPSSWGTLYFDYNKDETRSLLEASALYWLDQFHVDGLRLDAVSQMVKREKVGGLGHKEEFPAAIAFLKRLNTTVHREFPGVLMLAEETEGFPGVTKPVSEGGLGFDLRLACNWHHHMRDYISKKPDRRRALFHQGLVSSLGRFQAAEKEVLSHTHDDTAVQNRGEPLYHASAMETPFNKCADLRNLYSYQSLNQNSGTLIHMGEELGQRVAWDQSLRKKRSAVEWEAVHSEHDDVALHRGVRDVVKELNLLRKNKPDYWRHDSGGITILNTSDADNCVISYYRRDQHGKLLIVVHNFSENAFPAYDLIFPIADANCAKLGDVHEIFNSDSRHYGGAGEHGNGAIQVLRNEHGTSWGLKHKLPALAALVFECDR